MVRAAALILALALLPLHAHGGGRFRPWRIDSRFGHYGQYDSRQEARGHFKDKDTSMLCGPTCLLNGMVRIREALGIESRFATLDEELARLVELAPKRLIKEGLTAAEMAKLTRTHLREQGIEASVLVVPVEPGFDFERYLDERSVLILLQHTYEVSDPSAAIVPVSKRKGGHFILLDGIPADGQDSIHVHDPTTGSRIVHLGGTVEFDDKSRGIWARRLPDSLFDESAVIKDAVLIRLAKRDSGV